MDNPKCTVSGTLRGGRAMCGYVIVGGKLCSLKPGECNLQEGALPGAANGTQATPSIGDPLRQSALDALVEEGQAQGQYN